MRVCYINRLLNEPWGCGVHGQSLVVAWRQAGHEVLCLPRDLVAAYGHGSLARPAGRLSWLPARLHARALDLRGRLWVARRASRLAAQLSEWSADHVFVRRALYDYHIDDALRREAVPYIAEVNAVLADEILGLQGRHVTTSEREREREFLRRAAGCVCVSDRVRSQLECLGVAPARIEVVPNGVDLTLFSPHASPDPRTARWSKRWRVVFAYCGTLPATHDTHGLLQAAGEVALRLSDAGFLFVGPDASSLARFPNWTATLASRSLCTGRIAHDRVASHLKAASICWAAFRNDYGSPLKLYEYWAMAKPVVIAGAGQAMADVAASGAGTAVPRGDVNGLVQAAIRYGTSSREELAAIGAQGRAWVEAHRNWSAVAQAYVDFAARTCQ